MPRFLWIVVLILVTSRALAAESAVPPQTFFGIEVVDQDTRRGVPLVELQATSGARYCTDSGGLIAFYEPGLMGRKVWFDVSAPGYEFAPDGFGLRGVALETKLSSTVGQKDSYVALRLGNHLDSAGTVRMSVTAP